MKQQTELKSVRYGKSSRPSTKSTVLFALATFFIVIHVVKSSTIQEEEFAVDNRNPNANGELNFYRYLVSHLTKALKAKVATVSGDVLS